MLEAADPGAVPRGLGRDERPRAYNVVTLTVFESEPLSPPGSVTVIVSVYVAGRTVIYLCDALIDPSPAVNLEELPSPQLIVTVQGPLWSGSLNDAPLRLKSAPTNTPWSPPAFTTGRWFGGGGVEQLMENDAEVDPPAGTFTLRWVPPLTEQFDAIPLRVTVWLPAERPSKVTLPSVSMC